MKHLVYFTFGEQDGNVYSTQVKELLNHWAEKLEWRITLCQVADVRNFDNLSDQVDRIYVKRKTPLLFCFQLNSYAGEIMKKLKIDDGDEFYFNSRGVNAYRIASTVISMNNLKVRCNNLDIRGSIDEFKYFSWRSLFYFYFKRITRKALKKASSVTVVTSNLRDHLLKSYGMNNSKQICVNPTLSILKFLPDENKKNLIYIGKIAWVEPRVYLENTLKLKNIFEKKDWELYILGNTSSTLGLENYGVKVIERMSPNQLKEFTKSFHTGFVWRDSSIVNKVAAPCKISDYLCSGMPVIYSGEIGSVKDFIERYPQFEKFLISIENLDEKMLSKHVEITNSELLSLSLTAQKYFGVDSVINRYIEIFEK